jgi:hypothetical protein
MIISRTYIGYSFLQQPLSLDLLTPISVEFYFADREHASALVYEIFETPSQLSYMEYLKPQS